MTLVLKYCDIIIGTVAIDFQKVNHNRNVQTNAPVACHVEDDNLSWEDFYIDELQLTITLIHHLQTISHAFLSEH